MVFRAGGATAARARAVRVTTFILVVGGDLNGLFVGEGEGLSVFTESGVDFTGVPVVGGHDEHGDTNDDEKDGADELGPESGDHEGDTPS